MYELNDKEEYIDYLRFVIAKQQCDYGFKPVIHENICRSVNDIPRAGLSRIIDFINFLVK